MSERKNVLEKINFIGKCRCPNCGNLCVVNHNESDFSSQSRIDCSICGFVTVIMIYSYDVKKIKAEKE